MYTNEEEEEEEEKFFEESKQKKKRSSIPRENELTFKSLFSLLFFLRLFSFFKREDGPFLVPSVREREERGEEDN